MSQENVEVAQRCFDAYNRRDLAALRVLNDPNTELDWSASRGVEAGVYRGIDAVLRFYTDFFDAFQAITIEPERFIDAGESVVVPNAGRLKGRDGIEVLARSTLVFTMRAHKVTRICLYQEIQQALAELGLRE
jgi:ketosteroid isomerase-like protein